MELTVSFVDDLFFWCSHHVVGSLKTRHNLCSLESNYITYFFKMFI